MTGTNPRARRRRAHLVLTLGAVAAGVVGAVLLGRPGEGPRAPDAEPAGEAAAGASAAGAGLVARPTAAAVDAPAVRGRSFVEGVVRRLGAPVPARVDAFLSGKAGARVPDSWLEAGTDAQLPATGALDARPAATIEAGADGRFRVGPLDPGTYELAATGADGARGDATVRISADGCVVGKDVDLRWGPERLVGRAVRADGTPWRGHVAAYPAASWDVPSLHGLAFTATDEEGRFTIAGLERGRLRVVALLDRSLRVTSPPVSVPRSGPEWTFVVDAGLRELSGRVVDDRDGRPLPGASVVVTAWSFDDGRSLRARASADAEGRFRVPTVGADASATATLPGFVPVTRHVGEAQKEVDFRLVRAARVHGRVLSEADGSPVPGVELLAVTLRDSADAGSRTVSGPDGRYEFGEVAPGSVMVAAFGGGWWSKGLLQARPNGYNPLVVELKPDATLEQDVVVVPAARATGKVVDAKGTPVVGALVGWTGAPPAGSSLYDFDWATAGARTASGEGGAFAVDALVPGFTYTFQAAAVGQSSASAGPFDASVEKPVTVDLRFPAPRWLEATVEDAGGRPAVGAIVQTWFQTFGGEGNGAQAVCDARGRARVGPLPEGQIWVMAHDPGTWNGEWTQVGGTDGEAASDPRLTATLKLTRAGGVRGRVRYADGTPVSDRAMTIQLTGTNVSWSTSGTLSEGRFSFDGVADGTYRIEVRLEASKPPAASVSVEAGGEEAEITLSADPAKHTVVQVVDGDGRPVPQAQVLHVGTDEGPGTATVYDGRWKMPPNSGEAWFEVHSPSSPAGTAIPWAAQTVGPVKEGVETVPVRLEPERRIEGVVHGADGRGVRGVRVRAVPAVRAKALEGNDTPHDATLSDPEGRFRLGRLWAGEYRLFVEAADTYAPCEPMTVQAGSLAVDVTLSQGLVAAVPVEDWRGRPLAKATLTAAIEGRQSVRAVTDAAGVARLVGLDRARSYRLEIEVPAGGENLGVVVDPWKPSEEPVRARRAAWVAGVVRGAEGKLVGGAHVTLVDEGGETNQVDTEGDGRFRFEPVAPGEYRLFAVTSEDPRRASPLVAAVAGGGDVVLALEPALEMKVRFPGMPASEGDVWVSLLFDGGGTAMEATRLEQGVATFRNVHREGTYAIYLRLDSDPSRIAYRRRIPAGVGELAVPFESARSIRGRLVAPKGATGFGARATGEGLSFQAEADAEGRYEVKGLPDGTFRLHGWAMLDGGQLQADGDAAAGGSVDLELRAR